jgi:hypothetical protein
LQAKGFLLMRVHFLVRGCCLVLAGLATALTGSPAIAQKPQAAWEEARAVQIEAARREGIPTTAADLAHPEIPADQNAATYMAKIRELDKASPISPDDVTALEGITKTVPTPEQIVQGRKVLEVHRERIRLIHQVAQSRSYWEPAHMLKVGDITVPDTFPRNAEFRDYARWLLSESMLLLYEGKPLDAVEREAMVFNLARQVASSGSVISLLVSDAIDALALGGMRLILYQEGSDAVVAEAVGQAITTRRSAPSLGQALRGEVVFSLTMSDSERRTIPAMLKGEAGDASKPSFEKTKEYRVWTKRYGYPTDPKLAVSRYLDMNDAHYLSWMRRILPLADLPYPEALSAITALTREAEKNANHPDYNLAAMSIVTWAMLPARKARHQAVAETVRTAAALLAWKTRQGHFPDSLAECVSPPPVDPFDLHTLRYRREGEGFVLYSIGAGGKFDGGQPDKKPRPTETLFRYPRPVYTNR